ncbi:hypothetical protein BKA61DRAFT_715021 [Leptodontidium sp. MPI-SDFR-AT-0119]|nr:hypothetical protein BKA61DRAFT_715021 [Leptodontidium sp. MPI-SDFR-AT-0119]
MRLLEIKSPGEFSLIQVATHNTLPYAILSHTWTDQEVTYQDLVSSTGISKSGYEKIKFCGEKAAKDGLRYFWVDTCYIDNANKCYVYLVDSRWEVAFRKSRWFTRGWTLQELIAPAIVKFYSKEGRQLGNKISLETIAKRKEWVAQRHTTEQEDIVYCLVGICEVLMPLLYGEGKEAAQKRLETAVKEFTQNSGIFYRLRGAPFMVPFDRNPKFTGRELQLVNLKEKLFERGQTTKLVIIGLRGVGKTQLVLELVYRVRDKHKNCSVIWIPATNMEKDKADVEKLVQNHLSKESTGQWLLVFDNADDVNMWISEARSELGSRRLIDYLLKGEHRCIVFISRNRKATVLELDEDTAIQLLQKSLINVGLIKNRLNTKALAAAYINENQIALADYLFLLGEQESDIIKLLSEDFKDDWRCPDYLSFMACIDPKNIPRSLLPAGASRKEEVDAIGTLEAYSFIIKRAADVAFDLHRLVHLVTRNWLRQNDLMAQWTERAIVRVEEVFLDDDYYNRYDWRIYLPHVRYALMSNKAGKDRETRIALSRRFGLCLLSDGRYNEAEAPFVEVMERNKRVLGQEHSDTLTSISNLASTFCNQGRWKEAEDLEVQVMETRKRVLGAEHPDTLTSMGNLASIYRNQGRWKEAEDLDVQVMETSLRVLGAEHSDTLTSMGNLASTFWHQGRWKEAEDLEVQVMETSLRVVGAEHPDTLTGINNLAHTWKAQGQNKEALKLMEQCAEARARFGIEIYQTKVAVVLRDFRLAGMSVNSFLSLRNPY